MKSAALRQYILFAPFVFILCVYSLPVLSVEAEIKATKKIFTATEDIEFNYKIDVEWGDYWGLSLIRRTVDDGQYIYAGVFAVSMSDLRDQTQGAHSFGPVPVGEYELTVGHVSNPNPYGPDPIDVIARESITVVNSPCSNIEPEIQLITLADYANFLLATKKPLVDELIISIALARELQTTNARLAKRLIAYVDNWMRHNVIASAIGKLKPEGISLIALNTMIHRAKIAIGRMEEMTHIGMSMITWERDLKDLFVTRQFLRLINDEKDDTNSGLLPFINRWSTIHGIGVATIAVAVPIIGGGVLEASFACRIFITTKPQTALAIGELVVGAAFNLLDESEKMPLDELHENPVYVLSQVGPDVIIFFLVHGKFKYKYTAKRKPKGSDGIDPELTITNIEKVLLKNTCGESSSGKGSRISIGGAAHGKALITAIRADYKKNFDLNESGASDAVLDKHFRKIARAAGITISDDIVIRGMETHTGKKGGEMSADAWYVPVQEIADTKTNWDKPILVWDSKNPETIKALAQKGLAPSDVHSIVTGEGKGRKIRIKVNRNKTKTNKVNETVEEGWSAEETADALAHELHEIERWREYFGKKGKIFATVGDVDALAGANGRFHMEANQVGGLAILNLRAKFIGHKKTAKYYWTVDSNWSKCNDKEAPKVVVAAPELDAFFKKVVAHELNLGAR